MAFRFHFDLGMALTSVLFCFSLLCAGQRIALRSQESPMRAILVDTSNGRTPPEWRYGP